VAAFVENRSASPGNWKAPAIAAIRVASAGLWKVGQVINGQTRFVGNVWLSSLDTFRTPRCCVRGWDEIPSLASPSRENAARQRVKVLRRSFPDRRFGSTVNTLNMTIREQEAVSKVAELFIRLGASEVFVFGSAIKGQLRPNSDIDMAVSGLPALVYFSAISQASDLIGRPVDLVDLDDDSGLVRYLRGSGELVRVA
jgi:predicted nucleotidyltransferase